MSDSSPFDELPELTLSLRSFGSRRGGPNEETGLLQEQDRFFAPLLEGRRTAAQAVSRPQAVAAFEARRLTALIDATIREFAAARFGTRAPARRAFEAELFEIIEPLHDALRVLRGLAEGIPLGVSAPIDDQLWALWVAQLRVVFHVADSSWPELRAALVATPTQTVTAARWPFGSRGERHR